MKVYYSNHLIRQEKVFFGTLLFYVGSGIRDDKKGRIRDPDPGSGINIPDPQHW
jgi:hypothetical protein